MAIIDGGSNTANRANVDSNYNLQVRTPVVASGAGFVTIASEIDSGAITGQRVVRNFDASYDNRMRVGIDTPLFVDRFAGAVAASPNTALYNMTLVTWAAAAFTTGLGWASLNNTGLGTVGSVRLQSWRTFPIAPTFGTTFTCYAQLSRLPLVNSVTEWGLGIATGSTAPSDGVFFRYNAAGVFQAVSVTNGGENPVTIANPDVLVGQLQTRKFEIKIQADSATFWIDDARVAVINRAEGGDFTNLSGRLPILFRTYNTGIIALGQNIRVSSVVVTLQDANSTKPWASIQAGMGMHGSQGQTGGTMGSTANYTNNMAMPVNGVASNTVLITNSGGLAGLGGQCVHIAQATGTTDLILFSYLNPAGTTLVPGRVLYIHGVRLAGAVLGAAVATTPTTIVLVANYGGNALTLAQAEAATTKGYRRVPLGIMTWPVGSAIGSTPTGGDLYMPFTSPIPVNPGEYFAISAKYVVGTATASQTIYMSAGIDSYWE